MARILGLDPGLNATGWGLLTADSDAAVQLRWGTLRPPAVALAARLSWIHAELTNQIERLHPDVVAIERPFVHKNVKTAVMLGQSQAAAMIAAAAANLDVHEYPPRVVKEAVAGHGQAEKSAVKLALEARLGVGVLDASADAADALAVAYCHLLLHSNLADREIA